MVLVFLHQNAFRPLFLLSFGLLRFRGTCIGNLSQPSTSFLVFCLRLVMFGVSMVMTLGLRLACRIYYHYFYSGINKDFQFSNRFVKNLKNEVTAVSKFIILESHTSFQPLRKLGTRKSPAQLCCLCAHLINRLR